MYSDPRIFFENSECLLWVVEKALELELEILIQV